MKAMIIRAYGGPEVFELGEVPEPAVGPSQVLVRVRASSVNPVDCAIRAGVLNSFVKLQLPAVLGVDVAGEVVRTGTEARRFRAGERVFGYTGLGRTGGYGELASVDESALATIPDALSYEHAGTVPGVGCTAQEAFTIHAPVRAGTRLLVNGGAGGVGTYAIQVAKAFGAHVTATASQSKHERLRALGADELIDYRSSNPFGPGGYDVILNAVRGARSSALRAALRPGGKMVSVTATPPETALFAIQNLFSSRKSLGFFVKPSGVTLRELAQLIERGMVQPVVEKTYSWRQLADAHRHVEAGRTLGKIAVVLD